MRKIREDLPGALHVGDLFLEPGAEVPAGVDVPDEYLLSAPKETPQRSRRSSK